MSDLTKEVFEMSKAIFSLIPRESLDDILKTLQAFTELPVQLIDSTGETLMRFGGEAKYCSLLNQSVITGGICRDAHRKAGEWAQKIGEAYIFTCHAGLNHIAFPLIHKGELLSTIIIGPFIMDKPDSTIVSAAAKRYALSPSMLLDLYDELMELIILPPSKVNNLKKLLEYLLVPLLPSERSLLLDRKEKLHQQSLINDSIQRIKEAKAAPDPSFIDQEKLLLTKARTGDIKETKRILNEILGQILFSEGGNIEKVRLRATELTTLLSRVAIDSGASADSMRRLSRDYLAALKTSGTIEDICFQLQNLLEGFMSAMFFRKDKDNQHIRSAIQYIAAGFTRSLTLDEVARYVGLSPNYFSTLFHETTGVSFSRYLNRVRVEESKRLLLSSDYTLAEIAVAVGFPDQSYFSKVFKKETDLTPGMFRN